MTKLNNDEMVKMGCFNDPTEFVHLLDFDWFWDFSDNPNASIARLFCGVYIMGFTKDKTQKELDFNEQHEQLSSVSNL